MSAAVDIKNNFQAAINRAVTTDVIFFRPPADEKTRVTLADMFDANRKMFQSFFELCGELDKNLPPEERALQRALIFREIGKIGNGFFNGVQRMVHQTTDVADISEDKIADISEQLNHVRFMTDHSHMSVTEHRYSALVDAAINETFDLGDNPDFMRLNFLAAHDMKVSPERMIRHVPFPATRQFLQDWYHNNHGPMAVVRIGHVRKADLDDPLFRALHETKQRSAEVVPQMH